MVWMKTSKFCAVASLCSTNPILKSRLANRPINYNYIIIQQEILKLGSCIENVQFNGGLTTKLTC